MSEYKIINKSKNNMNRGLPGSSVVENPLVNSGDTGLIPGPERSHMPWSNQAHKPQLLSPGAATTEVQVLESLCFNKRNHRMRSLYSATREEPLLATTRDRPEQQGRPSTAISK